MNQFKHDGNNKKEKGQFSIIHVYKEPVKVDSIYKIYTIEKKKHTYELQIDSTSTEKKNIPFPRNAKWHER